MLTVGTTLSRKMPSPPLPQRATALRWEGMQLTREDLDEFKAIYRKEFDTELSDAEVLGVAHAALTLVAAVHRPFPQEASCTPADGTVP